MRLEIKLASTSAGSNVRGHAPTPRPEKTRFHERRLSVGGFSKETSARRATTDRRLLRSPAIVQIPALRARQSLQTRVEPSQSEQSQLLSSQQYIPSRPYQTARRQNRVASKWSGDTARARQDCTSLGTYISLGCCISLVTTPDGVTVKVHWSVRALVHRSILNRDSIWPASDHVRIPSWLRGRDSGLWQKNHRQQKGGKDSYRHLQFHGASFIEFK